MATHRLFDASSLQSYFRGNGKDYVKHVFSTGQRKWEVWLVFSGKAKLWTGEF